ncbi:hypothetical protein GHT09_019903 [Marmota monax]|uniref:Uncharacterized protein n=1 Tax=Marmota monax TaxID=9995 RepID=A0A834UJ23_MARMO|nr:hypothetical protein GHT09_019903 [Marmota monax]
METGARRESLLSLSSLLSVHRKDPSEGDEEQAAVSRGSPPVPETKTETEEKRKCSLTPQEGSSHLHMAPRGHRPQRQAKGRGRDRCDRQLGDSANATVIFIKIKKTREDIANQLSKNGILPS